MTPKMVHRRATENILLYPSCARPTNRCLLVMPRMAMNLRTRSMQIATSVITTLQLFKNALFSPQPQPEMAAGRVPELGKFQNETRKPARNPEVQKFKPGTQPGNRVSDKKNFYQKKIFSWLSFRFNSFSKPLYFFMMKIPTAFRLHRQ